MKKRGWFKWAVFLLAAVILTIGGMQLLDHRVDKFDKGTQIQAFVKHDRGGMMQHHVIMMPVKQHGGHHEAGWFWFLALAVIAAFLIWKFMKKKKRPQQHSNYAVDLSISLPGGATDFLDQWENQTRKQQNTKEEN
ncbi:hypothetical protein EV586_103472 [Tumebacillus sp. BK434]|uniref:hypothetical protein n=1 Tax=Tumebacillus sp. BK434 TaxID=2512169 RepID=UPI001045ACEB|nr:hypothetical protein [Tumebacillus sp. BK434]TCP55816.1 hypothetical protein EV586_103472 [Tumebacillus sp. BK434]